MSMHSRIANVFLLLLLLAAGPATAASIEPVLERLVKQEKLPGAVLLVSGPKGRQVAATGVANRRTQEAMAADTRFYIASSGKLATAAATLQLVQEGKLRLTDPVFPWVKDIEGIGKLRNIRAVTVEQLLKHRSGLAEYYTEDFEAAVEEQPDKRWSAAESLAHAYGEDAQAKPGREFIYTNTNYVLLGHLIERIDGTPYADALRRRIFEPLGMAATGVGANRAASGLAHGYARGGRKRLRDISYAGWNAITGDGAVVTTAADYEAFLFGLFRDARLLPARAVARMCRPQEEDPDAAYGLGCSIEETPWGEAWGHNGSISGFNADTWYLPKLGVAVVFMTNGDTLSDDPEILVKAVRAYLKE